MRILLHGINYAPELTGIGKYSGELAEWLAGRGHEVRVVTAPPYYPAWRVGHGFRSWGYSLERGQVRVYRCPLWVPERPSSLTRLLHLTSFMASSLPIMLAQASWRPDVALMVEPALLCAPATLLTAWLAGSASWLHIQDFEINAAFDMGFLPADGVVHRMAVNLERKLMRPFDRISSVSRNMVERLPGKGVASDKTVLFPNWVDIDSVWPLEGPNAFRERLGLDPEKVVVLYAGNLGIKQGLELLPQLARRCAGEERIRFVFCGDGAFRPQLEAMIAGLPNVILLPLQPLSRLNELLNMADIHLLPQRSDAADLVMPSKLTGMLASGRPVVATAAPGTQVAMTLEGCGVAIAPGDTARVAEAILALAGSPSMRARMGVAARRNAVENLGKERVLERFEAQLQELTRPNASMPLKPSHSHQP